MSEETANDLFNQNCLLRGEYVGIVTHIYCPECLDFYPKTIHGHAVLCPDCGKVLAVQSDGKWTGIGDKYSSLDAYLAESENDAIA